MSAVLDTAQTTSVEGEPQPAGTGARAARRRHDRRGPRHSRTALVLAIGVALWLFIGLVPLHLLHNTAMLPGWMLLGAALVPGTMLWIMSHRITPADTVSASTLVTAAAVGGFFAFAIGGTLDALTGLIPQPTALGHGVFQLALAGFVEEFAKGALIVVMGWRVAKTARNGLFLGGAVGIGFAIIESTYYIGSAYGTDSPVLAAAGMTVLRGVTAPFMHVLWSALLGAAIFAAARNGRYRLTLGVLAAYVGVAVLHGVYDGGGSLVGIATGSAVVGDLANLPLMIAVVVTGALVWRRVARRNPAPASTPASGSAPTSAVTA